MGKTSKRKATPIGSHELHLDFREVNSGVNQVVVGVAHEAPQNQNLQAKAIAVPYDPRSAGDDTYDARVSAIELLFENIRSGCSVTIYTHDEKLHQIFEGHSNVPNSVVKRFQSLVESLATNNNDDDRNASLVSCFREAPDDHAAPQDFVNPINGFDPTANDPVRTKSKTPLEIAGKHAALKVNALTSPSNG